MIKAVVIHQPNFLPRLKVFIKIAISDIWVIYDDVQYVRREWQNRVYLRDSQQKEKLFTAPIKKTDFHDRINNVQLSNVTILNENLRKYFRYNYSQSPYYKWIEEYIEKLMIQTNNINNLSNYNIICTNIALDMLGLEVEELLSSKIEKLNIDRNKKLIEICNKSNSFNYICGSGGRTYINEAEFNNSNINVIYYDYSKISKTDIYNLNTYQNYSFLDFIAYNGEDVLKSIIIEEKFKQIEKFKKGVLIVNSIVYENLKVIWDYMHMNMVMDKADCIVGFGNYNDEIALRAAELYKLNYSSKILFTGGLGRNTSDLWVQSEAERFSKIAINEGVPSCDIIVENKSTNTAENILFTREKLSLLNLKVKKIIGVHQPFMERRIYAALKVYWPEINAIITSPQLTINEYINNSIKQGLDEKTVIDVIVGDFQRIKVYANKGYQIPQYVPEKVELAYNNMVELGFTSQLI